jgi:putative DNA primase/helicase
MLKNSKKSMDGDIRYNAAWKKWIVWNGKCWQIDDGALIHEKGLEMVRGLYNEQLKTTDYRERMDIEKYAMLSESVRRREAFIKAASWIIELNISSEELDTNPWLLNVQNGTIDIQTGEFREHRQEDMITKVAHVDYEPNTDCPAWKQFVRETVCLPCEDTAIAWRELCPCLNPLGSTGKRPVGPERSVAVL